MEIAQALISRSALRHNLQQLKARAPGSKAMAVIKANAYGHGMVESALSLTEADGFAVARTEEAIKLRQVGIKKPILVLEGFFSIEEAQALAEHQIAAAIHSEEQLIWLEQVLLPQPLQVWLKVDTGMHRLGILPELLPELHARAEACDNIASQLTLMSHFACADEPQHPLNQTQLARFQACCEGLALPRSMANSAGILFWPDSHGEWLRPGISLYGISPQEGTTGSEFGLKPVMTMQSQLIAVRQHPAGESVGYGATWTAPRATTLGVVAMGYGDGYPRTAPNGTPVWINGREVPIVGRVSMDMLCVDLGANAQDKVSDIVELWGEQLPVERVAEHVGTIAYELVTRLTSRTSLKWID